MSYKHVIQCDEPGCGATTTAHASSHQVMEAAPTEGFLLLADMTHRCARHSTAYREQWQQLERRTNELRKP